MPQKRRNKGKAMNKLTEIFEQVKNSLHYGPAVEPFHRAMILAHEELQEAHEKLKEEFAALKERFEGMFPCHRPDEREYIQQLAQMQASAASNAVLLQTQNFGQFQAVNTSALNLSVPQPDHGASITDDELEHASEDPQASTGAADAPAQNPAEAGITPTSVSFAAQPEPLSAGPDAVEPAASDSTTDQPQGE